MRRFYIFNDQPESYYPRFLWHGSMSLWRSRTAIIAVLENEKRREESKVQKNYV